MTINWQLPGFRDRFHEAIAQLTESYPGIDMVDDWHERRSHALHDWCVDNCEWLWMTGGGIIDAATLLVESAYENGNIDDEGRVL